VARISFKKYEGLGNDFLLFELPGIGLDEGAVRRLCDRHFGVGGDGVLLVGPARHAGAAATMTILNADGSRPEMCGNGIRCVALHLARKQGRDTAELTIDTDAGPRVCKVQNGEVEVEMGKLVDLGPVDVTVSGRVHRFARVSAGNPHAITFEPYEPSEIDVVGPAVAAAPVFPGGTNVEFARLADDGAIDLVVWERGVGRTLACGTGASATVAAACLARQRSYDEFVEVRLPGGPLRICVQRDSLMAAMRGPARLVFEGEVTLP
jgi:diaminopimelate epimerase